jgi:hypothetical protein
MKPETILLLLIGLLLPIGSAILVLSAVGLYIAAPHDRRSQFVAGVNRGVLRVAG